MTKQELEHRVERAANTFNRALIVLIPVVLLVFFLTPLPWWSLPLLFLGGVGALNLYVDCQIRQLTSAIIEDGITEQNITVEVVRTSNEIVGRYLDQDVPEWVDVRAGGDERRYVFTSFAPMVGNALQLPADEGHLLFRAAHFQPEQIAS